MRKEVVKTQKTCDDGLVRVFQTPKGPHVYVGDFRVHHWMPGVILGGIALLGAICDDNKEHRKNYFFLGLVGTLLVLDDLPDFLSFLEGN